MKYMKIFQPIKKEGKGLMISLALQDADMLRNHYKRLYIKKSINEIINKEKILKEFEPINIKIRNEDNITSDNFYDNILNNCLIDTTIELINKERLYNESGNPLPWSSRIIINMIKIILKIYVILLLKNYYVYYIIELD